MAGWPEQLLRRLRIGAPPPPAPAPGPPPAPISVAIASTSAYLNKTLGLQTDSIAPTLVLSAVMVLVLVEVGIAIARNVQSKAAPAAGTAKAQPRATDDDEDDDDDDVLDLLTELPKLLRSQLSRMTTMHPTHFLASLIDQLGTSAFIFVSTVLSVCAVCAQTIAHRIRRFDVSKRPGAKWLRELTAKLEGFSFKKQLQAAAESVFQSADISGDGAIDSTEMYCLVLAVYCKLEALAYLTPPKREQVQRLQSKFDLDSDEKLNQHEFTLLAALLCENIAVRVGAQTTISLLFAPWAALKLVSRLAEVPPVVNVTLAMVPSFLEPYIGNVEVATIMVSAVLVSIVVPFVLGVIDEFYVTVAAVRTARALRHAKRASAKEEAAAAVKAAS